LGAVSFDLSNSQSSARSRCTTGLTFASLYCDTKSQEAFEQLFIELFDVIKRITGETFKLAPFFPDAKCRIIMLDGEVAQAVGLGKFLVSYNDPQISGITTRDPIEMLSYALKTCTNHFERYETVA
jgi:hypothetical protein